VWLRHGLLCVCNATEWLTCLRQAVSTATASLLRLLGGGRAEPRVHPEKGVGDQGQGEKEGQGEGGRQADLTPVTNGVSENAGEGGGLGPLPAIHKLSSSGISNEREPAGDDYMMEEYSEVSFLVTPRLTTPRTGTGSGSDGSRNSIVMERTSAPGTLIPVFNEDDAPSEATPRGALPPSIITRVSVTPLPVPALALAPPTVELPNLRKQRYHGEQKAVDERLSESMRAVLLLARQMVGTFLLAALCFCANATFDGTSPALGVLATSLTQAGELCYLVGNMCCLCHLSRAIRRSWPFKVLCK
jgi:hypothetical protein